MRRKSVWKQRTIAYLAAVSLAAGMIPASLPAADAYAEETDVEEIAVLEADVQQTDEQESDDFMLTPEQAVMTTEWYDYVMMDAEKIEPGAKQEYADGPDKPLSSGLRDRLQRYNQSEYIRDYNSTIYDINNGDMPTFLFGTFDTKEGQTYRFSFDYIMRKDRKPGTWELIDFYDNEGINTFDVYLHHAATSPEDRFSKYGEGARYVLLKDFENMFPHSSVNDNYIKMGTYLGQYQDWSHDEFVFRAGGDKTTIIFKAKNNENLCAALVTKMQLELVKDGYSPSNSFKAAAGSNLIDNGICDKNASGTGWIPYDGASEVSYIEGGNGGTGIELKKEANTGVHQSLNKISVKGAKMEYAFDIKIEENASADDEGNAWTNDEGNTVGVYLQCDGSSEKLTNVRVKAGEWQTVSGFYNMEKAGYTYSIALQLDEPQSDKGVIIDNVSVMFKGDADQAALDELKKDAKEAINEMKELTGGEKTDAEDKINKADKEAGVKDVLGDAAKTEIDRTAEKAKDAIDEFQNLEYKQKVIADIEKTAEEAKKNIKDGETLKDITDAKDEGVDTIENLVRIAENEDFYNLVAKAKEVIDQMENLTESDRINAKKEIGHSFTADAVLHRLKEAAKVDLKNKAGGAENEIDGFPNITDAEKGAFKGAVGSEKTTAEGNIEVGGTVDEIKNELFTREQKIDEIVNKAKKQAATTLDEDKKGAKDSVDKMDDLSKDDKEDAKKEIEDAKDKEGVNDALKKASQKEIDNAADKAKKEVDALSNLTQDEKNKVKDDIDKTAADAKDNIKKSDTVKEIDDATKKGVKDIGDLVDDAKKKDGKDAIDKMDNLSKEEKDKYKDEIDKADSEDKVNEILKDASKKDIDNQAKDAKDKIDKNGVLTNADKDELKKEVDKAAGDAKKNIDAAKNKDEIKKAADDGKAAINAVVNKVSNLNSLTSAEKKIWKNSESLDSVEKSITSIDTNKQDPKGSTFSKLRLKGIGKNKAIQLKWKRQSNADGYIIYGSRCTKGTKMKKLTTIGNGKKTTWTHKKCEKGKYYKYMVVAYKTIAGQQRVIAQSIGVHATTNGGKYGNPTKVIVKSKKKITLKKGKSTKIKATYKKNKKVATHISVIRFESSNKKVATVDKKGKVKAKKPGKCTIYVYSQNGFWTTVKVTVKK